MESRSNERLSITDRSAATSMGAGSLLADLRVAARRIVTRAQRRSPVRLDRGRTVTKPVALRELEKASSEKQIPQVVENLESGGNQKKSLEPVTLRVKQAL